MESTGILILSSQSKERGLNNKSFPNESLRYNFNSLELKVKTDYLRFKIGGTPSAC